MAARKLTKERRLAVCQRRASYCYGSQMSPNKIADRLTCVYLKELAALVQAYDLEKKIETESKVREKAQNMLSQYPTTELEFYEAAKQFFVSDQRMTAYKEELNKRRSYDNNDLPKQALLPSPAKLAISDVRIPLVWKDRDHFQNRGDSRRFALFALFRVGPEIRDTQLLFNVDRTSTDVTFDDVCIFEDVSFNFILHVSVYSCLLDNEFHSGSSAGSMRLRHKLRTSLPRSWTTKFGVNVQKNFMENIKFDLIASSALTVKDAGGLFRTFDLKLRNTDSFAMPPFFNNFCCNLVLQPTSVLSPLCEGVITIRTPEITLQRVFCRLKNCQLNAWEKQEDIIFSRPILSILLSEATTVQQSRRKNSLILWLPEQNHYKQCIITTGSEEESIVWKKAFDQQLLDHKVWGKFAEVELPLSALSSTGYDEVFSGKLLYEQVSLDASDTSVNSVPIKTGRYYKQPTTTKCRSVETINGEKPVSFNKPAIHHQQQPNFVCYSNNSNFDSQTNTVTNFYHNGQKFHTGIARSRSNVADLSQVRLRVPLQDTNERESEL